MGIDKTYPDEPHMYTEGPYECTEDGRTFTTGLATQIQGPASGNNWSDESVGTAVTPVPALPLAGIGLLGLLLAVLGSRRRLNDHRQLDASRGR